MSLRRRRFEVHHPGDYANLNSYQLRDGTRLRPHSIQGLEQAGVGLCIPSGTFKGASNPNAVRLFQSVFLSTEAPAMLVDDLPIAVTIR